jgi:hypothetical protein
MLLSLPVIRHHQRARPATATTKAPRRAYFFDRYSAAAKRQKSISGAAGST